MMGGPSYDGQKPSYDGQKPSYDGWCHHIASCDAIWWVFIFQSSWLFLPAAILQSNLLAKLPCPREVSKKKVDLFKKSLPNGKGSESHESLSRQSFGHEDKSKAKTEKTPAKGASPEKGKGPAKGPAMRKPASALTLPKDEGLSLEEKMEVFHKKGS